MDIVVGRGGQLRSNLIVKEQRRSQCGGLDVSKVKLCGYLKKKRNKVGGWRKMWFVLQDKLLLSYASKEEYDNKLVSFKDALNLVPGTLVRPLGGFRFTIETASNAMYTFHCDDRSEYREWITTLLDSLTSTQSNGTAAILKQQQSCAHRFYNYSMDNIANAHGYSNDASNLNRDIAHSFDAISQLERLTQAPPATVVGGVHLPIAQKTAKILERNGVNTKKLQQQQLQQTTNTIYAASQYRERRNFEKMRSSTTFVVHQQSASLSSALQPSKGLAQPMSSNRSATSQQLSKSSIVLTNHDTPTVLTANGSEWQSTGGIVKAGDDSHGCTKCFEMWKAAQHRNTIYENLPTTTEVVSGNPKSCRAFDLVKDKIQRINIKGSREFKLEQAAVAVNLSDRSKVITTNSVEHSVAVMPQPFELHSHSNQKPLQLTTAHHEEPIYAVVDLRNKYAQRNMRKHDDKLEAKRCSSYDSIAEMTTKHDSQPERIGKSISLTEDDIDGIYEDGEAFLVGRASNSASFSCDAAAQVAMAHDNDDEENIYEPINVSAGSTITSTSTNATEAHTIWRYFTRLKVNTFSNFRRLRRSKRNVNVYDSIRLDAVVTKAPVDTTHVSHFTNIRHKFGTQRKSMQKRMRKLCTRSYEPKPFCRQNQHAMAVTAPSLSPEEASSSSKSLWKSVKIRSKSACAVDAVARNVGNFGSVDAAVNEVKPEKRFFGSLPHLRKARASLFSTHNFKINTSISLSASSSSSSHSSNGEDSNLMDNRDQQLKSNDETTIGMSA